MYLLVFFDFPTSTEKEKKSYIMFRKSLLKDGFTMIQYSCYMRICKSTFSADAHMNYIIKRIPEFGEVRILKLTNNIYNSMKIITKGEFNNGSNQEKLRVQTVIEF